MLSAKDALAAGGFLRATKPGTGVIGFALKTPAVDKSKNNLCPRLPYTEYSSMSSVWYVKKKPLANY